jgi:uncharacterized protein (TIGR02270 family)
MARTAFVPEMIDQHSENLASIWLIRDHAVGASSYRLNDLARFDDRIEANVDGLRVAEESGWTCSLDGLEQGDAGDFFAASIVALNSGEPDRFDQIIECAYARAAKMPGAPYDPAYDPWRGLVSALAWVDRVRAVREIGRLLDTPRPRTRWLSIAACGARRMVKQPGLEVALADREPLVRARAARTAGALGRGDVRAMLIALLRDQDEGCRFWAAWSATLLGTTEGFSTLGEFARSPGNWSSLALDLLLRRLSIERATAFLRPLATDPARRRILIWAAGVIGDGRFLPWLLDLAGESAVARAAGDAFLTITGADMSELGRLSPPRDYQPVPNDDPDDSDVQLDEDEGLAWPDPEKLRLWWKENSARFNAGTAYFWGAEKACTNWITVLSDAPQRQRRAAALELALRGPGKAMFEVRARSILQRRLLTAR